MAKDIERASARERASSDRMAGLLRGLAASATHAAAVDRVPEDFALPAQPVGAIHTGLDHAGTVSAALLPTELRALTRSRRRDVLGLAWVQLALAPEGRAAVLVPASILSEATQGHLQVRQALVEQGRLHGVIGLPAGSYKPRTAAAVLLLGPVDTGDVWFCDGARPEAECVARWRERDGAERDRSRADSSFLVPRAEIAANQFDLSMSCYRTLDAAAAAPIQRPQEILAELAGLEAEIFQSLRELVGLLKA